MHTKKTHLIQRVHILQIVGGNTLKKGPDYNIFENVG